MIADGDKIALTPKARELMAILSDVDLKNFQVITRAINNSWPEDLIENISWTEVSILMVMEKMHRGA